MVEILIKCGWSVFYMTQLLCKTCSLTYLYSYIGRLSLNRVLKPHMYELHRKLYRMATFVVVVSLHNNAHINNEHTLLKGFFNYRATQFKFTLGTLTESVTDLLISTR